MAVETSRSWETGIPVTVTGGRWRRFKRLLARVGVHYSFTSITGRIIVLNLFGLIVLVLGILYLNQFREGLIEARVKSLMTQGEIIAGAIAQTSRLDGDRMPQGTDPLMEIQSSIFSDSNAVDQSFLPFNIDQEQMIPLLRRLVKPTGAHARVYDREGTLIADSARLYTRGQIIRLDLPAVDEEAPGRLERIWRSIQSLVRSQSLPLYRDIGAENGKAYDEINIALNGTATPVVRVNERGETIVSVGVPIQRMRAVLGALMVTTRGGDIDEIIAKERWAIVRMSLLVLAVTGALSLLLAGTIAGPMRRLAMAAERVRKNIRSKEEIPDFSHRPDEIGHLSRALGDMTNALYRRIEAIESFAADVSHELKNPLTSLRSAAETMALAKTEEDRARLAGIIQHDVHRLNRLITDISDASRLDAELARESFHPVNMARLLDTVCTILNDIHCEDNPEIVLAIAGSKAGKSAVGLTDYLVNGHDSRLSQVINNVLDNAMSFSPPGGRIYVSMRRLKKAREVEILIEDEGPGIAPDNLEKIFTRFYTDRPTDEEFGQNSGLGLHISRQIAAAHGGRMWAENRAACTDGEQGVTGARFVIRLPAL